MFKIYQTIYFSLLHLWPNNNKTFGGPFNKYSVNGLDAILGGSFSKVREQKIVPLGIRIWRPWLTQLALKRRAINHHCTPAVSSIYEIIKQVSSSIAADEKILLNGMDRVFNFVVYCWGGYFLWVQRTVCLRPSDTSLGSIF